MIKTSRGELDIRIEDESGQLLFEQKGIQEGGYELTVPPSIKISIYAHRHRGRFEIQEKLSITASP